jgi:septum formation protein
VRLLLASKSEARRRMLEAAGVPFEAVEAEFDEERAKGKLGIEALSAQTLAAALAERKALAARAGSGSLVLGSDQTLETPDGSIMSKPASPEEAYEQLRSLSGRSHRLHSAAAVAEDGAIVWRGTETVSLTMRPFSEDFLSDYLAREYDTVRWSVGGYHVEGRGVQFFERIEGSHFAVLGMPLLPLLAYLREREVLPA